MTKKRTSEKVEEGTDRKKAIKLDGETHKRLRIYQAENELLTLGAAVEDLLEKVTVS